MLRDPVKRARNRRHNPGKPCSRIGLLLMVGWPALASAQEIPEIFIWSIGVGLLGPVVAVPLKSLLAGLLSIDTSAKKLLLLCAAEWILWFPVGIALFQITGTPFSVLAVFPVSAWLHWQVLAIWPGPARYAIATFLALLTPALAFALFLAVLYAG